jgi:hypothetical protein
MKTYETIFYKLILMTVKSGLLRRKKSLKIENEILSKTFVPQMDEVRNLGYHTTVNRQIQTGYLV